VDVAKESAVFARNQVLVQSSTAMLAQANGLTGMALSLLG
jgi:flagellin-like hook-associated protein FlgL